MPIWQMVRWQCRVDDSISSENNKEIASNSAIKQRNWNANNITPPKYGHSQEN